MQYSKKAKITKQRGHFVYTVSLLWPFVNKTKYRREWVLLLVFSVYLMCF